MTGPRFAPPSESSAGSGQCINVLGLEAKQFIARLTERVFIRMTSRPAPLSPRCTDCDQGPASRPLAATGPSCFWAERTKFSGSPATCGSFTILPCSLITQIAVYASDTFNPTNSLIPWSSMWIKYGTVDNVPLILQAVAGSASSQSDDRVPPFSAQGSKPCAVL